MSTTVSSHPETSIWSAPSAIPKLHSRAREAETARCAEFTFTKSLERIEIPQCIYESCDGLGLLSKDPIGFAAGDANLYRMTGNHPNMATDPSGLDEVSLPWFAGNDVTYTPEGAFTGLFGIGIEWDHPAEAFTLGKLSSDRLHVIMDDGLLVPVSEIRKFARAKKTGVGQTVKQLERGELDPASISSRFGTIAGIRALAPRPAEADSIAKGLYNSIAKPIAGAHQMLVLGMDAVADPVGAADRFFVPWDPYEAISNSNRLYFDQAFDSREGTAEFTGSTLITVTPWSKVGGLTTAAAERLPFTIVVDRSTLSMNGFGGINVRPTKQAGRITEPNLPQKTIANENGVEIVHYTRSGDHGPPHLHVKGGGPETKIGQAGRPIDGSPELTATQAKVVASFKSSIRKAVDQIGRWFRFNNAE